MTIMKHTGEWKIKEDADNINQIAYKDGESWTPFKTIRIVQSVGGKLEAEIAIIDMDTQYSDEECKANAQRIVQCCNAHDSLVEALKAYIDDEPCSFDHHGFCQTHSLSQPCRNEKAKQALAQAEKQ